MKTENGLFSSMVFAYKGTEVDPGRRIRFCRHMRGLEMKELAIKAGLDPSYMCKLELNRSRAKLATYEKIARALRLTTDEMFGLCSINWNR
jgi:transcriptional regulator with XRE-family HTH domain